MNGEWFDAMLAAVTRARTRRAVLGALATAMTIGAALGAGKGIRAGELNAAPVCRGFRSRCKGNSQCCSGRCRKRGGKKTKSKSKDKSKKKRRACACSRYLEPCLENSDCCTGGPAPMECTINKTCEI